MKKANYKNKQQMLRVQSFSGRGRPVLLPFNIENVKSIKIINASNFREQNQINSSATLYATKSATSTPEDIEGKFCAPWVSAINQTQNLKSFLYLHIKLCSNLIDSFFSNYMYQLYVYSMWLIMLCLQ